MKTKILTLLLIVLSVSSAIAGGIDDVPDKGAFIKSLNQRDFGVYLNDPQVKGFIPNIIFIMAYCRSYFGGSPEELSEICLMAKCIDEWYSFNGQKQLCETAYWTATSQIKLYGFENDDRENARKEDIAFMGNFWITHRRFFEYCYSWKWNKRIKIVEKFYDDFMNFYSGK